MRVKIETVLTNFGEERYIVKYLFIYKFLLFFKIKEWIPVTYKHSDDPYFYEDYEDAKHCANNLLANANPYNQRVVQVLDTKEVVEVTV